MNPKKAVIKAEKVIPYLREPLLTRLKNSVPLYMINAGSQPVVRIDLLFRAGSWWQSKPLVASTVNAMLTEGTTKLSGREIARKFDFYGAYLNTSCDRDNASVTLYTLEKHIDILLPLLAGIIKTPSFPEKELTTHLERRKQSFLVERTKVATLAREKFSRALYGPRHPYGNTITAPDFGRIGGEDLFRFHPSRYSPRRCSILVSGKFNEQRMADSLGQFFGTSDWPEAAESKSPSVSKQPSEKKRIFFQRKGAIQSALRVGRELFDRKHPDYRGMEVLNNILGGHFGSRLMQNIREKKGYTYGIGSAIVSLQNSGFFVIISEVGTSYIKNTLREIYVELNKLSEKPVSGRELELTASNMLGNILRGFDGPFACSESIRNLLENDLDTGFYKEMIETINHITPRQLQDLATRYLSPGEMYEVTAGEKHTGSE